MGQRFFADPCSLFFLGGGVVIGFVFGSWLVFAFYVLVYDMRDDGVKKKVC